MSKENLNVKDFALVSLKGRIIWSDKYPQKNGKFVHAYLVSVVEEYEGKEFKHVFNLKKFNCEADDAFYIKGDKVRVSGFLKVSSYKNKKDEWVNSVFVQIHKITSDI